MIAQCVPPSIRIEIVLVFRRIVFIPPACDPWLHFFGLPPPSSPLPSDNARKTRNVSSGMEKRVNLKARDIEGKEEEKMINDDKKEENDKPEARTEVGRSLLASSSTCCH